jgi:predicted unusual protein kinase regulating ubiquinone biosynthesis (AarF/ABC1/UbiB family)
MTRRGRRTAVRARSRWRRNGRLARLTARIGIGHASTAARKLFVGAARREELSREREMRTAEQVATELGRMKGALMKLGQMASYLDDGLPEPMRAALASLQSSAPPMSAELVESQVREEFGAPPEALFREWDPDPIAAASIGQVHRAIWRDPATGRDRAVAVKVQYPGVADAIAADLRTADLLGTMLALGFKSLDPDAMVAEIKERLTEELDYRLEAANQRLFHDHYRGHPFVRIPAVIDALSGARVLTTELATGATWNEVLGWDQHRRDMVGETIFRFVFRSLYRLGAFNGDPHPGNYLFGPDGEVTFLDFGLVKHFTDDEMSVFKAMITAAVLRPDPARFRRIVEEAGLLMADAPVDTDEAGRYFSHFYEPVRTDRAMTWTSEYSTSIVRHTFDRSSPIAQYATVPRSFVFIQRINLGLYALLGHLGARGNYRAIAEELWPMTDAPPSTPMGEMEARWLASRRDDDPAVSGR